MILTEVRSGGRGPKLYTVKEAADYLDCSERQVREEIRERKITYRRPPGGIRFTEQDLIDRLRPLGGPSVHSRQSKRERKCSEAVNLAEVTSTFELLNALFDEALHILGDALRKPSRQTAKVVKILESCLRGEPCGDVSVCDAHVAKAIGVTVAARTMLGENANSAIRKLLNINPNQAQISQP